jgi:RimJ/RimL family protein N-acetyltransferase
VGPVAKFSLEQPETDMMGEVLGWALTPSYGGKRLARKLLVHGVSVLKRRQCDRSLIWIEARAQRAKAILIRLGFQPEGVERMTTAKSRSFKTVALMANIDACCYRRFDYWDVFKSGTLRTGEDRRGQDRTGQDRTGQDR